MSGELPAGFVLDNSPPPGFVLDKPPSKTRKVISGVNRSYAGMAGFPVQLAASMLNYSVPGYKPTVSTPIENPLLGPEQVNKGFEAAGIDLNQPRDVWGMLGEYLAPVPLAGAYNAAMAPTKGPLVRQATKVLGPTVGPVVGHTAREGVAATAALGGGLLGQQIAEKTGGDPMPWEMAGSMLPSAFASLAAAVPRYSLRKGDGASAFSADPNMQRRISELDAQGLPVTVGLATDSPVAKTREAKLAASPGGYEVIRDVGRQADAAFDSAQQRIVGGSSDSIDSAGRVLNEGAFPAGGGIFGRGGYVERWRSQANSLYAALDAKIPPRTPVTSVNTGQYFGAYGAVDPAAPALSAGGKDPRITEWARQYASDTQASLGQLPYERLKDLRSQVGAALEVTDPAVLNSAARADMKRLYSALSDDMEAAARVSGATNEFTAANRFYRQGSDRIETWLDNLNKKVRPEDFWKATVGDSPQSATQLSAYKRMLKPDEWDFMVETVSNRWGRVVPGQETIAHQFQLNKWYTNWNKTPVEVRDVLFGKQGSAKRDAAELMAKNLDKYREQSQVLFNSSGSAGLGLAASAQYGAIGGVGTAVLGYLTGQTTTPLEVAQAAIVGTAGGVMAATAGSAGFAKLTTNQNFARWLAQGMEMPSVRLPGHLMRLASIASNDKDLKEPAKELIRGMDPELYAKLYAKSP
jgi:hypothetical protein